MYKNGMLLLIVFSLSGCFYPLSKLDKKFGFRENKQVKKKSPAKKPKNTTDSVDPNDKTDSEDKITYQFIRENIIVPRCMDCHDAELESYEYLSNNYELIVECLQEDADCNGMGQMPMDEPLSDEEIKAFLEWGESGFLKD